MKIIGHRGAKGLAPENTLAGIRKALEHHVEGVEIDVRVTQDGQVILEHDAEVSDASGTKLLVATHTYAQLKAHKPDLTLLSEAIELLDRKVPLAIEVKPGEPTAAVIANVRSFIHKGWHPGDLLFISFDYKVLKTIHAELPDHTIIMNDMWSSVRVVINARRLGTKDIGLWAPFLWTGVIRALSSRGYHLYTSPVNSVEKADKWLAAGLTAFCTDYPDLFDK